MSKNVLVKADPTLYQQPGDSPTIRDLGRAFFRGRGTRALKPNEQSSPLGLPAGEKVGVGRRLAAGLGLAGKVGAAAATAQQTAERMQGGDFTAPLQAGYTYQANDPTGTLTAGAINAEPTAHNRVGVTSMPLPAAGGAANDPKLGQSQFRNESPAMAKIRQERLGLTGPPPAPAGPIPLPVAVAPAPVAPQTTAPTQAAPAPTTSPVNSPLDTTAMMGVAQQPVSNATPPNMPQPPVSNATPPNMGLPQAQQLMGQQQQQQQQQQGQPQNLQHYGPNTPPGQVYPRPDPFANVNWKAFTDTVFDKLGPDMVYKMTPHQLGTLSAYMYLKLS